MSRVIEMQLSVLYTKAAVVHTWYGLCIRVISTPATVAAFLLFHTSTHRRDPVTYSTEEEDPYYCHLRFASRRSSWRWRPC